MTNKDDLVSKDTALKMAIEAMENIEIPFDKYAFEAINACKEALEQPAQEVKCSNHPDAPHGFCRDASHTAGRYVCECEGWQPAQKPLSDDEINVFINPMPQNIQNDDLREFARAIEKAHGIGE